MKHAAPLRDRRDFFNCSQSPLALLIFVVVVGSALTLHAESRDKKLEGAIDAVLDPRLIDSTAICIRDLNEKRDLFSLNCEQALKPASVMKLVTSSAALSSLGPDFVWKTKVDISELVQGRAREVVVRGVGDPSLTTESLWMLARRLKKAGVESIDRLIVDGSAFTDLKTRSGARAYEGGTSALTFNFNSIGFEACPTSNGKLARVVSDPWEAGQHVTNQVLTRSREREPVSIADASNCELKKECRLAYQAVGTIAEDSECSQHYRSVERPDEYFAHTLQQFLRQLGVQGKIEVSYQKSHSRPDFSFSHASKSLRDVLNGLNNFSTNVTADQLVYTMGCESEHNCSFEHGVDHMRKYLRSLNVPANQFVILDGSGLSHENKLSGAAIVKVLQAQADNIQTGLEFEGTLAVWGRSGTLKSRGSFKDGFLVRGKTGSLDGVSALAGYIYRSNGAKYAFALLQNRVASKAKAVDIEDQVVELVATH